MRMRAVGTRETEGGREKTAKRGEKNIGGETCEGWSGFYCTFCGARRGAGGGEGRPGGGVYEWRLGWGVGEDAGAEEKW